MSHAHLELAFAAAMTGFVFLSITLSIVFYTIHKDIIRSKPRDAVPGGHASSNDARSLALLPLSLNNQRLWISPDTKKRMVRYGLDNDTLVSEGDTMDEAVQGMLWNSRFRELKRKDDEATARSAEYE